MSDLQSVLGDSVQIPDSPEANTPQPAETPAQTAPEQAETPEHQEPKLVPLAALHEERARRRELQQEIQRERQAREEMQRRVEERLAALQPKEPIPSLEENPAAHILHKVDEVGKTAQTAAQQLQALQQQQAQEQQFRQIATTVQTVEQEFRQAKPDYDSALQFMLDSRAKEFAAFGHDASTAKQLAAQEMAQSALMNAARGLNPAEIAYRVAEARGYRPATVSADQKLQMQAKGVAASKSLGTGAASGGKMSADALLSMSDEEFAEATKGNNWRKLMGG